MPYGYNPATHHPEGWLKTGPAKPRPEYERDKPIEAQGLVFLLDKARAGCKAAQAELAARGPSGAPRA